MLTEERLKEIEERWAYKPGDWTNDALEIGTIRWWYRQGTQDVQELLSALREAQEALQTARREAIEEGRRQGLQGAINHIDHYLGHGECCGCWGSRNETELKRIIAGIRALPIEGAVEPGEWTIQRPTESGYYWLRRGGAKAQIVEVQVYEYASTIVNFIGAEDFLYLSDMWFDSVEWQPVKESQKE